MSITAPVVSSAVVMIACGIDAVGTQPLVELPDGAASSSTSSSGSAATDADVDAPDGTASTDGADAVADAIVDVVPDAPPLVPPYLVLTHSAAPATINLTTEGTTEWAHWGYNGNASSIRKANPTNPISALSVGGSALPQKQGFGVSLTWSDGPTGSESGTSDWFQGVTPGMFCYAVVRAPSGPAKRTFVVFVGGTNIHGRLTASVSDASVAPKVDTTYVNLAGSFSARYAVDYATVGAAQVEMRWEPDVTPGTGAELRFAAAALR